jgi:hypothetical protein
MLSKIGSLHCHTFTDTPVQRREASARDGFLRDGLRPWAQEAKVAETGNPHGKFQVKHDAVINMQARGSPSGSSSMLPSDWNIPHQISVSLHRSAATVPLNERRRRNLDLGGLFSSLASMRLASMQAAARRCDRCLITAVALSGRGESRYILKSSH